MASKLLFASAISGYYLSSQRNTVASELAEAALLRKAICLLESQPNETAKGVVHFSQAGAFALCEINGNITGLAPNKKHGFHIHQYGNLSQGCVTAGPHYNPFGHTHSGPKMVARHVGDLGNV